MKNTKTKLLPALEATIKNIQQVIVPEERRRILVPLILYISERVNSSKEVNLHFICTHNSRRSQFAQIWAQTAAAFFGIPLHCYSGGVEVTAFNPRAVDSLKRMGFNISAEKGSNPEYQVHFAIGHQPLRMYSKLVDDPVNRAFSFAAVMTCAHADEHCPFIPGADIRIPLRYDDPKAFDDTPIEAESYDKRSLQIAAEMFYVCAQVNGES